GRHINAPVTSGARTPLRPIYQCPSEIQPGTFNIVDAKGNPLVEVALGNYVALNGVPGVTGDAFDNNGAFLRNKSFRIADFTDGLSNTLFVGERCTTMSSTTWTGAVLGGVVPAQRYPDPAD